MKLEHSVVAHGEKNQGADGEYRENRVVQNPAERRLENVGNYVVDKLAHVFSVPAIDRHLLITKARFPGKDDFCQRHPKTGACRKHKGISGTLRLIQEYLCTNLLKIVQFRT